MKNLRLAVSQLRMDWEGEKNVGRIVADMELAAREGAQVCVFPELAVTGSHRRIAEMARVERVAAWRQEIVEACRRLSLAVSVGAPTFDDRGGIYISQLFYDAQGELVAVVEKRGLTAPEATFFVPGEKRPTFAFCGHSWSAMICREIDDADRIAEELSLDRPEIVLWPGAMRPDPEKPRLTPPEHVRIARRFAQWTGAFVVQCNWPNALNRPEESKEMGHSVVIAPTGEIRLTLPRAEAGVALFHLGETTYVWHPQIH